MRVSRKLGIVLASVAILALIGGGVAFAAGAIPGPGGVINGCYDNQGLLRVIASDASCKQDETAISWNQTGPQGSQGPQGDTGPQGPQGPQGPAGLIWMGAWSSTTNYQATDAVSYNGGSWVAVAANSNVQPGTNSADWQLLAEQGATGPQGPQGTQGPVGPAGPAGAGLKTAAGWIDAVGHIIEGSGFTVANVGPGLFTITFPAGTWSDSPVVTVSPAIYTPGKSNTDIVAAVGTTSQGDVVVDIITNLDPTTGTGTGAPFYFTAVQP